MQNLELLRSLVLPSNERLAGAHCLTHNVDTGHVYVITGESIVTLNPKKIDYIVQSVSIAEFLAQCQGDLPLVVAAQYLADIQSVCIALRFGDVLSYSRAPAQQPAVECVGSVDGGISAMCWSPDEELGAFISCDGYLLLMTKDYDILAHTRIDVEQFGAGAFVTVGWGKKETQFHGSEGKQAAVVHKKPVDAIKPWDDQQPRLSWRGDGQFLVVSTVSVYSGARKLRVFSRDGILQSTSEDVDGLEHAISWRPSGTLITSSQRLAHRHDIVFFEGNGLRHGEFSLPFARLEMKVCEVAWNNNSSVLAVHCESLPATDHMSADCLGKKGQVSRTLVQLWTTSNYHYYLKQQLEWTETQVVSFMWDTEQSYRLHVLLHDGQYACYDWCVAVSSCQSLVPGNDASVAVIDGGKLLVTAFRKQVVPPPLSSYTLALSSPAQLCAFAPCGSSKWCLAVLLGNNRIAFFSKTSAHGACVETETTNCIGPCVASPCFTGMASIPSLPSGGMWQAHCIRHLAWLADSILFAVVWSTDCQQDVLLELQLQTFQSLQIELHIKKSIVLDCAVWRVFANADTGSLLVETIDGRIWKYVLDDGGLLLPWLLDDGTQLQLQMACARIQTAVVGGKEVVLALTDHYRLFLNQKELASNCTSFAVHNKFLLFTTHSHTCHCLNLDLPIDDALSATAVDESVRRVERGSTIVIAVPFHTKLVLQMPRGNLETVHPRALVLSSIRDHLDNLEYGQALSMIRRHRINTNLLYDHQPEVFLENARLFVEQVSEIGRINLFLSDLRDEDVTVSMYPMCNPSGASLNQISSVRPGKVSRVCDALRAALLAVDANRFLLSILMTHIKKPEPELEDVLTRIRQLQKSGRGSVNSVTVSEAIKFILYMVDVEQLYDVALGMYDIDLVLMVAEKSHKDPKEYMPFLNGLRQMSSFDKYKIDVHLHRYANALVHISQCEDKFEMALNLVKKHHLYKDGLKLFANHPDHAKAIANAYGDYLTNEQHLEEAGIVYSKHGLLSQALTCYIASANWRQALCVAHRLEYSKVEIVRLSSKLAGMLKDRCRYSEAVQILIEYSDDVRNAVSMALDGQLWGEAFRLIYRFGLVDEFEPVLKSAVLQAYAHHLAVLQTDEAAFSKHSLRLRTVREEKAKRQREAIECGVSLTNGVDDDLYSNASSVLSSSSMASYASRQSARSAKNRRKAERKKHRLREGGMYEEEALMDALAEIVNRTDCIQDEVGSILPILCLLGEDDCASELQRTLQTLILLISDKKDVIWSWETAHQQAQEATPPLGPQSTTNQIVEAHLQASCVASASVSKSLAPSLSLTRKWRLLTLD